MLKSYTTNDIRFLWLSGMNVPDHNSINRFRSGRTQASFKVDYKDNLWRNFGSEEGRRTINLVMKMKQGSVSDAIKIREEKADFSLSGHSQIYAYLDNDDGKKSVRFH
ncbi:MAG TPA: hypothetical protein DDZ57_07595 [Porphyromonadaceae bacterium]|nr:hypothetical protein [Porphyromonadaceae bacterium]